ncbi:transcriptional regulator [[Kitasatospora] papulosa]|uniref:transcriptional regulator n=1 Tax=Streptomyces TaxID=1883 RepID=UPI0034424816
MFTMPSGTLACPDTGRQRRLAAQLAGMIPGAATIQVGLNDPKHAWPHPHAKVKDGAGKIIPVGRVAAAVAARWITRVWPEADWSRPHTFDIAAATLTRSDLVTAGRGR